MPESLVPPFAVIQMSAAENTDSDSTERLSNTYRWINAFSGAINRPFPRVKKIAFAVLSLTVALSAVELTRRLIFASVQDISKPPPLTDQDVRGMKGEIMGVGLFFGVAGGGGAGVATGHALKLFASLVRADQQYPQDIIFCSTALGLICGALGGVAYTNFVDITLDTITP